MDFEKDNSKTTRAVTVRMKSWRARPKIVETEEGELVIVGEEPRRSARAELRPSRRQETSQESGKRSRAEEKAKSPSPKESAKKKQKPGEEEKEAVVRFQREILLGKKPEQVPAFFFLRNRAAEGTRECSSLPGLKSGAFSIRNGSLF